VKQEDGSLKGPHPDSGGGGDSLPQFGDGLFCSQTGVRACVVMQDKFIFPFHPGLKLLSLCTAVVVP
jgi:hypothetical protein